MKKIVFPIVFLLLCCCTANADGRGAVRFGMDWGYGLELYKYWNLIYLDSEVGYVVQDQDSEISARPHAYYTLSVGFEPGPHTALSLFSGIMGVSKGRSLIPLGIQANYLPRGNSAAGPIISAAAGTALDTDFIFSKAVFGLLGAGWRFRLNDDWSMDLLLKARMFRDFPPIWDTENRNYVEQSLIRKNYTLSGSLELGIAISF